MKLKAALGILLLGSVGSAYAGVFTGLALLPGVTVTGTAYGGGLHSGTAGVKATIPHAFFNVQAATSGSAPSRTNHASGASVTVTAQFELFWTQTIANEVPPAVIYRHHTLSSAVTYNVMVPTAALGFANASISSSGSLTGASISGGGPYAMTYGDIASNTSNATYSFIPSWTYVSTNGSGFHTYKTITPTLSSPTAQVGLALYNSYGGSGVPMGTATASADDNFYFSDI